MATQKSITNYINKGKPIGSAAQNHLRQLVERYPYFHAARLLYLQSLYQSHDAAFGRELKKAALYVPSRTTLFNMFGSDILQPQLAAQKGHKRFGEQDEGVDRTSSLIGQFLHTEQDREKGQRKQRPIDASADYIGFLEQTDANNPLLADEDSWDGTALNSDDLIDEFLNKKEKIVIQNRTDDELMRPNLSGHTEEENEVLTEMMAGIYIKQEKYEKALAIIRKLSLKYPKKNRYFVDQMRFLEKLIINSKNK